MENNNVLAQEVCENRAERRRRQRGVEVVQLPVPETEPEKTPREKILQAANQSLQMAVIVDSQTELLKMRRLMKPRAENGARIMLFKRDSKDSPYMGFPALMLENPYIEILERETRIVLDKDYPRLIDNFMSALMLVTVDMKRQHQFRAGLWLYDNTRGKMELFVKAGKRQFQSLMTGVKVDVLPDGCRFYMPFWTPPSGVRKETVVYYDVSMKKTLLDVSSHVTTGAMDALACEELSIGDGNKCGGRMACPLAPIRTIGYTSNYAVYDGKFADGLVDGMAYVTDAAMAKWLSVLLGIEITKKAARGLFMQARPTGVSKCSITVVSQKMMKRLYDSHGGTVYGDGIDVYLDKNALKATFNYGKEITIHIMDIAKVSPAYTSVQVLRKLASSGVDKDEFLKFLLDLFHEDVAEIFRPMQEKQATVPSFKNFRSPNVPVHQVIAQTCTDLITADRSIFKTVVCNGLLRKLVNNANMLRHMIDGMFGRLQSDIAIMFGQRLLRFGEVFIAGYKGKRHRGQKCRMFKYPTIGLRESYEATVITIEDIIPRVWATGWDNELCLEVINYYKALQPGVIVLPAIKEIMNLLAGCDYDWDGALVIFDQRFVKLMCNCKPLIVNIDTSGAPKDTNKVAQFCLDNSGIFTFGTLQRQRAGSSVGEITNESDVNDALLSAPFETQEKAFQRIFDIMPEHEYVGLTYSMVQVDGNEVESVTVCPEDVRRVYNDIRHSFLTPESVSRMIRDQNVIFRMLQELTIDSVKTGVFIKPVVKYSEEVVSGLREFNLVKVEWSKDGAGEVVCSL